MTTKAKPNSSKPVALADSSDSGDERNSLLVIVGPTASGKSALAMELAESLNGEIIAADSRTIYKGMDIGTAKPTQEDQQQVRHYLLDVAQPDQAFSAAQFKDLANKAIVDVTKRGKLPMLVGGTGLYIDSVLFDFQFGPLPDQAERDRLNAMTVEDLQAEIKSKKLPMPENSQNKRHLTRLLETGGAEKKKNKLRKNTVIVGLAPPTGLIKHRIGKRINVMIKQGLIDEIKQLAEQYGWDAPGMSAPAYRSLRSYVEGLESLEVASKNFAAQDRKLAKRQMTWFKRNPDINWFETADEAIQFVKDSYNKH